METLVILNEEIAARQKRLDELSPMLVEAHRLQEQIQALRDAIAVLTRADDAPARRSTKRLTPLVLDILQTSPLPMTPSQIADACAAQGYPTTNASVGVILNRYLKKERAPITRLTHGFYQFVSNATAG